MPRHQSLILTGTNLTLEWANPKFAPNKNGGKND